MNYCGTNYATRVPGVWNICRPADGQCGLCLADGTQAEKLARMVRNPPPAIPQLHLKSHSELRHIVSHLYMAIEAQAKGHTLVALDNLKSVEGLIFFESDQEAEDFYRGHHGKEESTNQNGMSEPESGMSEPESENEN